MSARTMLLAVHNTATAGSTVAREVWQEYNGDERRWIKLAGRRRTAVTVRFRPCGVVEDASSRKNSYSCSYRLVRRARQHDNL